MKRAEVTQLCRDLRKKQTRAETLPSKGIEVNRFQNDEIELDTHSVLLEIKSVLNIYPLY